MEEVNAISFTRGRGLGEEEQGYDKVEKPFCRNLTGWHGKKKKSGKFKGRNSSPSGFFYSVTCRQPAHASVGLNPTHSQCRGSIRCDVVSAAP